MDPIDFAERKTEELARHHLEDMAILNREAHHTFAFLTLCLAAVFGYVLRLYEPQRPFSAQNWQWLGPVSVLTLYLGCAAVYLLRGAMMAREVHPIGNLPAVLIGEDAPYRDDLPALRKAEMWGLASRIALNRERNQRTARVLNRVRGAILGAPLVFIVALVAA